MCFDEAFNEFIAYSKRINKKQTVNNLTHDFNKYILPYFTGKIINISKQDFINWQDIILTFNFSNSYNKKLYSTFSRFLNFCCWQYNLKDNVARQVGCFRKKYEPDKHDFYTYKEFQKFISNVDNIVYKQYFNLLFFTGVRPSEAMALKFSDLKGFYISINKSIQRRGNREIDTPKTVSSYREVIIDKKLRQDLLTLQKYYERKYGNSNDYFLFGGIKPLAPTTIDRVKKKACGKANLRVITQHQFRHSHATLLHDHNIPLNEIQRRLGHKKMSTTLDIYILPDLSQEKRVTRTLNSLRFSFFNNLTHDFKNLISIFTR